jgi:AraC-like DNA-binding protein
MSAYLVKELLHYCNVSRKKSTHMPKFKSDYYDFTFVLKGRLLYRVNGELFEMRENDAIFLPPDTEIERYEINEPVKYVSYNFIAYEDARLPEGPFLKEIISEQILNVVACFSASHIAQTYSTKEKVINLLNYILHELNDILDFKSSNPHIISIIRYINEYITEPITLTDVSDYIGLTKEHTAHIFKRETGMTVTEYVNRRKMLIAKDMICSTLYPLQDIAERLGYEGYSYFSRTFKKEFGISPSKVKRNQKI